MPASGRSGHPADRWEAGVGRASPAGGRVLRRTRAAKANAVDGVLSFSKWVFHRFQQLVPLPGKASRVAKFFTQVALAMSPPLRACPLPN